MSRGVYRLKFHLAKIPGHDVEPCINTTPKLIQRAMRALETLDHNRKAKEEMKRQLKSQLKQVALVLLQHQPIQ